MSRVDSGRTSWGAVSGTAVVVIGVAVLTVSLTMATATARLRRPPPHTVVSIEFDHAFTDALPAVELANRLGIRVTLFAMSGRLGRPGYLSADQLVTLQAAGNEIGGHTIDHEDLSQLPPAAQQQAVCGDRAALLADGLDVTDFAYPYGHLDTATPAIVRGCGYESARGVGGLAAPACIGGCRGPRAESIPPADPFDTRTADSVLDTTSLATVERYVTQAERRGGGWVQIVLHHVCNACDTYAISPSAFSTFAEWLAGRASLGTVSETVHEVIDTPFIPAPLQVSGTSQTLRLPAVERCPSTPVGSRCETSDRPAPLAVLALRAPASILVRAGAAAKTVSLRVRGRRFTAAPLSRAGPGTISRWRLAVRIGSSGRAKLTVSYPLGVAIYRLRIVIDEGQTR
jgi:peptidoglycan/xylan/chitin deacetylase (PgdA/CDA1 family)